MINNLLAFSAHGLIRIVVFSCWLTMKHHFDQLVLINQFYRDASGKLS
jgi:hypothetical protein